MNLMRLKWLWFGISAVVLVPGLISLALYGLNLGIDFTGGTSIEEKLAVTTTAAQVSQSVEATGIPVSYVTPTSSGTYIIRTKVLTTAEENTVTARLQKDFHGAELVESQTVGPTISSEILKNALLALFMASVFILLYIAWAFRSVPKPANSFRFGVTTLAALLHDVLVVVGIFSILGHFLHVEVDENFVIALLTVVGFSVHDTIVTFDRIRENLRRNPGESFTKVANDSILQTIVRSLSTSLTVVLTLLALFLLTGSVSEPLKWFLVALLVGIISGTYSSVFNATPLLVLWQERSR